MSNKDEATRLADALRYWTHIPLMQEIDALLRRWPDGEPVMFALRFSDDERLNLSTVFDTLEEAQDYASRCTGSIEVVPLYTAPPAEPDGEPVAWYVERVVPGMRDNGTRLGPFWWRPLAEEWCDERHKLRPLYTAPPAERIAALESAREVQDAALAVARNDFRELALRAEKLETVIEQARVAIEALLHRDELNTCQHVDTYRGGAIWTICNECGGKWADDEGGMPEWADPPEWDDARAVLRAIEEVQHG